MLPKIRHYIAIKTLKSIYHVIFESHLPYASLVCAENSSSAKRLLILQKKSLRLFFQNGNAHTGPLFKNWKILKFSDKVALDNCILISKSLHKSLSKIICNWFTLSIESCTHNTWLAGNGWIYVPSHRTKSYGRYLVTVNVIHIWNFL